MLLASRLSAAALEAYRECLRVRERLAAQDPTNAGWQRDLSASHNRVGDVLLAQGDAVGALEAYRETLRVHERLAAQDPTNADWQRDLSVSYFRLARVCEVSDDSQGAYEWDRRCHGTLSRMRAARMHLDPPVADLLSQLDDEFGSR